VWVNQDYLEPYEGNTVMFGPVCSVCGAIGEVVMGWREAGQLVAADLGKQIAELKSKIEST